MTKETILHVSLKIGKWTTLIKSPYREIETPNPNHSPTHVFKYHKIQQLGKYV